MKKEYEVRIYIKDNLMGDKLLSSQIISAESKYAAKKRAKILAGLNDWETIDHVEVKEIRGD